ncbi:MAG TPA: lipid II flippase MurJ [Acidimicrobiia bacterium]|nr:lipid II flippase MurJ [Acidimicrobiia bacterium]
MSPGPRIGTAAAIVAAGVLLSRVLGFGRDLTMAVILGRTAETDLYQYAFTIPDFAFYLVAGGFLSITLIPILSSRVEAGDEPGRDRAFTAVFRTVALILAALTGLAAVATPTLVELVFPEVTGPNAERLVDMTRIALLLQVLFALGALFSAVQFTYRRFLVPTLGPIIYNAGIILGGVIGSLDGDPSPESFLLGGVIGAAVGSFGLQWWGAHRLGVRFVTPERNNPAVHEYLTLALPLMIGQTVIALDEQWPRAFGQFGPDGTTAGLQYARRLMMLPVGVVAQAAGVAAYPYLAGLAARGDTSGLRSTVDRSMRAALVISVPVTLVVVLLSDVWVRLALQYGAFTPTDTAVVASLLAIYASVVPFWVVHQVITRAFYSRRQMWTPVFVGTSVTVFTVPALFLVAGDGTGIAAVSAGAVATYAALISLAWYRNSPQAERREMLGFIGRVVTAVLLATAAAVAANTMGAPIAGTATAVVVFLAAGHLLGVDEIESLSRKLLRSR